MGKSALVALVALAEALPPITGRWASEMARLVVGNTLPTQYLQLPQGSVKQSVVEGLFSLGDTIASGAFMFFGKLIDLAKTNPLWGGVLGIAVVDIMGHHVDWVHWTHEETYVQATDQAGNPINLLVQIYDLAKGTYVGEKFVTQTLPGVLTGSAVTQISAIILTAFGIAEAGAILSDITEIGHISGNTNQNTAALVTPSVTTLVEAGASSAIPITVTPKGTPAGVA